MRQVMAQISVADILVFVGFIVLVTGVALYAIPLAAIVAGVILLALGLLGSR